jgi:hypothetical protein
MKKHLLTLLLTLFVFSTQTQMHAMADRSKPVETQELVEKTMPSPASTKMTKAGKRAVKWKKRLAKLEKRLQKKSERLARKGKSGVEINLGFIGLIVLLVGGLLILLGVVIPIVGVLFIIIGSIVALVGLFLLIFLSGISVSDNGTQ